MLLSSFVGALSLFYNERLGQLEEIHIKSENENMIIISKYKIILIMILDKNFLQKFDRNPPIILLNYSY